MWLLAAEAGVRLPHHSGDRETCTRRPAQDVQASSADSAPRCTLARHSPGGNPTHFRMETSMSVPMVDPPVLSMQLADKRTLTLQEFGDPVGRPALYFHGGGSASFEAGIFHREALASGLRLISTNRPGAGGTSLCDGRPVAAYSDDVAELLDHLRIDRCACFGESNGGMVTLAIASRLSARILGAVPINPTLPWFDPLARLVSSRAVGFGYWTLKYAPWAFGLGLQKTVAKYRRIKSAPYTMTPTLNSPELFGPPPGTEEDVGEILWKVLMQV